MKRRFSFFFVALLGGLLLAGANGCSSNPNVEGAKLDLRNEDYDRALENVNTALESDPNNAEALKLKGDILVEKADEAEDVEQHSEFIQDAMASYQKALENDPELEDEINKARRLAYVTEFKQGSQAFNRGKEEKSAYGEAAQYFANAASIQPDSAGAFVNQAFALLNAGDTEGAIEPLETAIEKGADDVRNYRYLARLYQQAERPEDAIGLLEEARERYPEDSDVQSLLLNAYVNAGQTDRAMDTYRTAVEREPDNKLYRYNYGSLLLEANQFDQAIEQLERAVEIDPSYTDAQYNLGATYVKRAVAANDSLRKLNDEFRGNRDQMSESEQEEMRARMKELAEVRETNFSQAIPPLERAYELTESAGDDTQGICQSLFQAYVQTGQEEQAQSYADCAGYEDKQQN